MINVIGLGYIGLPTALMLAVSGNQVMGTDKNQNVVDSLNHRELTFKEEGLDDLFFRAVNHGIQFTSKYQKADVYIISVPTPYDKASKKVNTKYIEAAVGSVLEVCPQNCTIVIESTVSPGVIDRNIRPMVDSVDKDVKLGHAPERIIPGAMLYELEHNARTIGTDDRETGEELKKIYGSFCKGEIVLTDIRSAEMSKVVENTFRDINIAFANELAKICHFDNMDVYEIIRIANKHPRVNILSPGPGVGGHCISVDPWFLVGDYPGLANIILAARKINDSMPEFVLKRIGEIMEKNGIQDTSRVGLYGLTYKENVDDVRESPTLQLLSCMKKHLASPLLCYDPMVKEKIVENQVFFWEEFLERTDFVVIMVGHDEIVKHFEAIKDKIVLDTRKCVTGDVYHL
ncbi:MAG: nucleotide sugar dehydrogenase [Lachnospiraceae bacterium]|jgi:UDP-N-acetyl-D-mannosaminuronic acid dehydrogenase|nr:nucleotide sugar dehydrogenase [Lachnospiraceae bacterium]